PQPLLEQPLGDPLVRGAGVLPHGPAARGVILDDPAATEFAALELGAKHGASAPGARYSRRRHGSVLSGPGTLARVRGLRLCPYSRSSPEIDFQVVSVAMID